jgi:hypothetical protein
MDGIIEYEDESPPSRIKHPKSWKKNVQDYILQKTLPLIYSMLVPTAKTSITRYILTEVKI